MKASKPQLATNAVIDKIKFPVAVQMKWDGERLMGQNNQYLSRKLKYITNEWLIGELKNVTSGLKVTFNGFDGEMQVDGLFSKSQGFVRKSDRVGNWIWHIFDVIPSQLNLPDDTTFEDRHAILSDIINGINHPRIKIVPYHVVHNLQDLLEFHSVYAKDKSLDGTIYRNLTSTYKHGKSTATIGHCMKLKDFDDSEAEIIGFTERMKNNNEAQTNELGRTFRSSAQDGLEPTGVMGTYLVRWNDVEFHVTTTGDLKRRKNQWDIRQTLIGRLVKFQYQGLASLGKPRFPTELGLRDREDLD